MVEVKWLLVPNICCHDERSLCNWIVPSQQLFLRADNHGDITTEKSIGYGKEGVARLYRSKASLSGRLVEEVDTQDKLKWSTTTHWGLTRWDQVMMRDRIPYWRKSVLVQQIPRTNLKVHQRRLVPTSLSSFLPLVSTDKCRVVGELRNLSQEHWRSWGRGKILPLINCIIVRSWGYLWAHRILFADY